MSNEATSESGHPYDAYLLAVNASSNQERIRLLGPVVADDFRMRSPGYEAHGRDEAGTRIGEAMAAGGTGLRLVRATNIDEHHGIGRVVFDVVGPDDSVLGAGMHVFERSGDTLTAISVFPTTLERIRTDG